MRFATFTTTITIACFFLNTVTAVPVKGATGQKNSLSRSSSTSGSTRKSSSGATTGRTRSKSVGATSGKRCKRAEPETVIAALQGLVNEPLGKGTYGAVHPLSTKIDGHDAVVKILKKGVTNSKVQEEVRNLKQVHQYIALAEKAESEHTGEQIFYIVMPNMGISEKAAIAQGMTDAKTLKQAAQERYKTQYHMISGDLSGGGVTGGNYVFKHGANGWEAEIIDWALGKLDSGVSEDVVKAYHQPDVTPIKLDAAHCVPDGASPLSSKEGSAWDRK